MHLDQIMKFISLIFLPIFFILLSEALGVEYVDYRLVSAEAHGRRFVREINSKCVTPGLICNGCKEIHLCDNKNESSLLWTCSETETCNNGLCSMTTFPNCSPLRDAEFTCNNEGVFPDPGNCFKYHFCVEIKSADVISEMTHIPKDCKSTTIGTFYSYNPRTAYCDKKLTSEDCSSHLVPLCSLPGQTAALSTNPSMYYICKKYIGTTTSPMLVLYPFLYVCENGKNYDGRYQCQ